MGNSLKKSVINTFACSTGLKELNGNKIVLVTAAGLISGRLSDGKLPDEAIIEDSVTLTEQHEMMYNEMLRVAKENFDGELNGSDGFFFLTDASIKASENTVYDVGNIVVFYDQIIGVLLGSGD